ncbi:MAG: hypothetical protein R3C27_05610 [Hyphomonadaceae bacterium]
MRLLASLSLLVLAACNPQPATYAPDVARNFLMACEAQGSSSELCSCTWDRIEADIPPGDFAALERMPGPQREAHPLTAQINGYVEACAVNLAPQPDPNAEDIVPEP